MSQIALTKGQVAIIDEEDYVLVSKYKWNYLKTGYATTSVGGRKNKKMIYMHRLIMDAKPDQTIDHINGNKLDNRKVNLRFCDDSQNGANSIRRSSKQYSSKYKGVFKKNDGRQKCWIAQHIIGRKKYYIGAFYSEEEAKEAYKNFVIQNRGEYAKYDS